MHVAAPHMTSVHRGQKKGSESTKVELEMTLSYHVSVGSKIMSSAKAASAPNL